MERINRLRHLGVKWGTLLVLLVCLTAVLVFIPFSIRFTTVYKMQAEAHMADVTETASEGLDEAIMQIDQLSVWLLINRTVQERLENISRLRTEKQTVLTDSHVNVEKEAIAGAVRATVLSNPAIISARLYSDHDDEILIGTSNQSRIDLSYNKESLYSARGSAVWFLLPGEEHYIGLSRAILSTKAYQPIGYLTLIISNDFFGNYLRTLPGINQSHCYLLSKEGGIMSAGKTDMIGDFYPIKENKGSEMNLIDDIESQEPSFYHFSSPLTNGWKLMTTVSAKNLYNQIYQNFVQMLTVLFLLLVIIGGISILSVKRMIKPTLDLLESMKSFEEGNMNARVKAVTDDEIGQLAKAYNHLAESIQNLFQKNLKLEVDYKESEIEFLKMQINPHFLYNTLDTISWLSFGNGNDEVSNLTVALARFLRASIKREDFISIKEEMQTVNDYLFIQHYRFGDKIEVTCDVDPEAEMCYIPSFILQPLIENSMIHGLEKKLDKGHLHISIRKADGILYFLICDDGIGMTDSQMQLLTEQFQDEKKGKSIGLRNVYRRLDLLYGKIVNFKICSEPDRGTRITFHIPAVMSLEQAEYGSKINLINQIRKGGLHHETEAEL